MWQTVIVLGLLTVVLIYVIRHFVKIFRGQAPTCAGCSGGCGSKPATPGEEPGKLSAAGEMRH
jgi:hypothetical protein